MANRRCEGSCRLWATPAGRDATAQRSMTIDDMQLGGGKATLIIPAYNEERGLAAVLRRLESAPIEGLEIIVVDDGSTDSTAVVAEASGVRLLRHETNRGKGAALQSGLAAASTPRIVVMDADDTYPTSAIATMVALLEERDYVRGLRTEGRAHIPRLNRFGNRVIAAAVSLVSGVRSSDPLTGLYALRTADLRRMRLASTGFGIETEIAIKSARLRLRSVDLPIRYGAREGTSKLNPVRDGWVILRTIVSLAWAGARNKSSVCEAD